MTNMTNMTDKIRILLKAYGEELTLEQIIKLLAGKAENLKDEINKAIPELLEAKQIIQTKDNTYKTTCKEKPNYFFVFQNNSFTEEVKASCLFCSHSPENHTVSHWDSIGDIKEGDIIFHECGNTVAAISEAQSEARNDVRPYSYKGRAPDEGRRVDTMYVSLRNQINPTELRDVLYPAQPERVAPFNRNGKGNEGYLFYFNQECAKIIIDGILKNCR